MRAQGASRQSLPHAHSVVTPAATAASPERPRSVIATGEAKETDRSPRSRYSRRGSDSDGLVRGRSRRDGGKRDSDDGDRSHSHAVDNSDNLIPFVQDRSPDIVPRQAVPSLRGVADSTRGPILASDSEIIAYTGQPLSSKTACARQADLDAQTLRVAHDRRATVANQYPKASFRNVESIQLVASSYSTGRAGYHISSESIFGVRRLCDSAAWVLRWQRPIHQAFPENDNSSVAAEMTA